VPGAGPLGGACGSSADCSTGACLDELTYGWEDGACVQSPCSVDGDCGTGNHCRNGVCLRGCLGSGECRQPEYQCWPIATGGVCAPAAGSGVIGDACVTTDQCPGGPDGFCVTEAVFGWSGGYCLGLCISGPCPTGSNCVMGGACFDDCTADMTCRPGFVCVDADGNGTRECMWGGSPPP
jgi:hypothetical protein